MINPHVMARSRQWWSELASVAYLLEDPDPAAADSLFAAMHGHAMLQIASATAALLERGDEAFERVLRDWWNTDDDQYAGQVEAGFINLAMERQPVGNVLARIATSATDADVEAAAHDLIRHQHFVPELGLADHVHAHQHPRSLAQVIADSLQETILDEIAKNHDAEKTQVLVDALCHLPHGADLLAESRAQRHRAMSHLPRNKELS